MIDGFTFFCCYSLFGKRFVGMCICFHYSENSEFRFVWQFQASYQVNTCLFRKCLPCLVCTLSKVVERTTKARAARRHEKIQEYFYGLGERLYPHIFDVRFSDIHIYKVGGSLYILIILLCTCASYFFKLGKFIILRNLLMLTMVNYLASLLWHR